MADISKITLPNNEEYNLKDSKSREIFEEKEISGSIVSFKAETSNAIKSLTVNVEPVQDLHGYDYPWPAGGGVNKINFANCTAGRTAFGLTSAISGEYFRFTGTCSSGGAHTWVFGTINSGQQPVAENLNFNGFVIAGGSALVVTAIAYNSSNGALSVSIGGLVTNQAYEFVIGVVAYEGSTVPTAWSPYSNICPISGRTSATIYHSGADTSDPTTYTIQLGDTVYGGKLDVTGGKMVVDRAMVDLGTLNWGQTTANRFYSATTIPNFKLASTVAERTQGMICEIFPFSTNVTYSDTMDDMSMLRGNNANTPIHIRDSNYPDTAEFKTAMSGVQLCYEIATPIEITLTPTQIDTLLGTNNIWADAGPVDVTYGNYLDIINKTKYEKPSTGIPKTDLANDIQTSL